MSAERLASEIQEDFLTCEICICPFSSDSSSPKAPKVLSCLHTFCREDLSKAISPGDEQVECFVCRAPTALDRVKGVDSVKTNFMLQKLISACKTTSKDGEDSIMINKAIRLSPQIIQSYANTINNKNYYDNDGGSTSICEHCTDDVERPVVWCCRQCSEEYCLSCVELHTKSKKLRDHELTAATASMRKKSMSRKCSVHKSEDIKFVCETCGPAVMCCSVCVYDGGHHENRHKILSIESAASRHRDLLTSLRDKTEEFYTDEMKVLEDITSRMTLNQANLQSTVDRIKCGFARLREIIDEKEAAWLAEVESQASDITKILAADRKAVSLHLANAELFIDTARRLMESYSDIELLDHHKKVESDLCEALKVLSAPYELTGVAPEPARDIDETLIMSLKSLLHRSDYQLGVNKIKVAGCQLDDEIQGYLDTISQEYKNANGSIEEAIFNFNEIQSLQGHTNSVRSVAFNRDGRKIVSGSSDKTVKVWDSVTGFVLQTLRGHTNDVASVAFNHDGRKIVSGSFDSTVKVWNSVTGDIQQTLRGHTNEVYSVAFNHDGSEIVSGSDDYSIRVWDSYTGVVLQSLYSHTEAVFSVSFNHDGSKIVSGSFDNTIKVWNSYTGAVLQTLQGHTEAVNSVAFNHDGSKVVSGSYDNSVMVWDAVTGVSLLTLQDHTKLVSSVSFNHDGSKIVSGSSDSTVKVWDSVTGAVLQTLQGHSISVNSVAFNHDGSKIVSGSSDNNRIKVWGTTSASTGGLGAK